MAMVKAIDPYLYCLFKYCKIFEKAMYSIKYSFLTKNNLIILSVLRWFSTHEPMDFLTGKKEGQRGEGEGGANKFSHV